MSIIVAIKDKDRIYFGADSQVTSGSSRLSLSNPNNYKIWKVKNKEHCLMGSVGAYRDACVIRVLQDLLENVVCEDKPIAFEQMVDTIVPKLITEFQKRNYLLKDGVFENFESRFIFADRTNLFTILSDGAVMEIDDFTAIGSGESEAFGSLYTTSKDDDPIQRIIKAIKSSATRDIYVAYPIIITDTITTEFTIINN